jgi:glycosyltransferase involved in cell wall biosynthesis
MKSTDKGLKYFMISDYSEYTVNLVKALKKENIEILGPKNLIKNKFTEVLKYDSDDFSKKIWTPKLFTYKILRYLGKFKNKKIIHIQHEFFGLFAIGTLLDNFLQIPFLLFLLKLQKNKTIVTLHNTLPQNLEVILELLPKSIKFPKIMGKIFLIYLKIWYKLIGKLSSQIIVHSECFKEIMINDYGINPSKIFIVRLGVLTQIQHKKIKHDKKITILHFGVISPRKGIETVIKGFKKFNEKYSNSELVFIGKEPNYYKGYLDTIKKQITKFNLENNIKFTGFLENEKLPDWFAKAEMLILPYSSTTSASGVFTTGLFYNIPMIASKTRFFEEETDNGKCCILIKLNDIDALSEGIIKILEDEVFRKDMLEEQKKLTIERSWEKLGKETMKVYDS